MCVCFIMYDQSKTSRRMSSHCNVPSWNERNPARQQQFEQVQEEEGATEGQKRNKFFCNSPPHNTSRLVHMPNYGVRELTWENGQLNIHGLCELVPSTATAKPAWMDGLNSCETLESVVHQAALHCQLQSLDNQSRDQSGKDGSGARKRMHSDSDLWFGDGDESLGIGQSVSPSASAAFNRDNDTKSMSWASYESCRSLKTARTADRDYAFAGSETQETEGEEHETKGESGRSGSRRGRAAAVHNESERRRRDRINQRMKTLQKLVPNASKTDKVSILDDVIEYLKQLQAQVQMMMDMRANFNLQQQMMMSPQPQFMQQQQQQRQFHMSLLAAMAQMEMASGGVLGGFFPPAPLMVPSMATQPPQANNKDNNFSSSVALSDPYSTFLAQTMNMDLYNKMAAAIYKQQSKQTTQVTSNTPSHSLNHGQGD